MVENIFEYASRNKVRFPYKGSISTEDLWDLGVTELDKIFKTLNTQVKQSQEESLLTVKTKENTLLDVQVAVIKHIVATKLLESDARERAVVEAAKKQKIMSIIAAKQDEELQNKSIDELKKMLAEV